MLNVKTEELEILQDNHLKSRAVLLEKKIITNGENKNLIKELAAKHYEEGNYLRALSCYIKLLEYEPRNAKNWNRIAVIFIRLEKYKTAIEFSKIAYRLINSNNH
ncbi:MAG TPA: hypothetical protein VMZ29_06695 [Candidatus Bathyarchaeia archaeon]|nr:hypothetical protein [Candidatus Bathyarchaeia archaeon]